MFSILCTLCVEELRSAAREVGAVRVGLRGDRDGDGV